MVKSEKGRKRKRERENEKEEGTVGEEEEGINVSRLFVILEELKPLP